MISKYFSNNFLISKQRIALNLILRHDLASELCTKETHYERVTDSSDLGPGSFRGKLA